MDIFDTSALRAISLLNLRALSWTRDIVLSPISVCELLCHIDEPYKDLDAIASFHYWRSQLFKATLLGILHDPYAQHAIHVGATSLGKNTKFEEKEIAIRTLDALSESDSLNTFYSKHIKLSSTEFGRASGCGVRARDILKSAEDEYLERLHRLKSMLEHDAGVADLSNISETEFWGVLQKSFAEMLKHYESEGVKIDNQPFRIVNSIYIHYGYTIARIVHYFRKQGITNFSPERNDTEDSWLVLHLNMFNDDLFVTNDKGQFEAVMKALSVFKETFRQDLMKPKCGAIMVDDYMKQFFGDARKMFEPISQLEAYRIWSECERRHGFDVQDWHQAQAQLAKKRRAAIQNMVDILDSP